MFVSPAVQHERAPRSCQKRPIFGSEMSTVPSFPTSMGLMPSHGMNLPPLPPYYPSLFPPSPFKPPALHPFLPSNPPMAPLTLTLSHNSAFKPSTSSVSTFNSINNINSINNLINTANNAQVSACNGLNFSSFNNIDVGQINGFNFSNRDTRVASITSSSIPYSITSCVSTSIPPTIPSTVPLTPPADSKTAINDRLLEKASPLIGGMNYLKSTNNRLTNVAHLPEFYRPIRERLGLSLPGAENIRLIASTNEQSAFNTLRKGELSGGDEEGEVSSSVSAKGPPTPTASPSSTSSVSPFNPARSPKLSHRSLHDIKIETNDKISTIKRGKFDLFSISGFDGSSLTTGQQYKTNQICFITHLLTLPCDSINFHENKET